MEIVEILDVYYMYVFQISLLFPIGLNENRQFSKKKKFLIHKLNLCRNEHQ